MSIKTAVLLLNFGEPERPTLDEVIPFLERIFTTNAPLMGRATPEEVRARSRALADARAPGLIDEYEEIGSSPLHPQAREQAEGLQAELDRRGAEARVLLGYQFTDPSIADAVEQARDLGAQRLVLLPVYPLAGPSTTVAAQNDVDRALAELGWEVEVQRISGWHLHPAYLRLRADAVRRVLRDHDLSLDDARTRLVFSAHGTPLRYLEDGNGYEIYVRDFCERLARELGALNYELGYQNHTNRPGIQWTQPDIDRVIDRVDAQRVVVDPVSFMHEQSETLAELDHELREQAEARGLEFFRVPVPFADPAFFGVLADLVQPFVEAPHPFAPDQGPEVAGIAMRQCICNPAPGTFCMNPPLRG